MLIPSELWVKALIRRCQAANVPAMVVRHGDDKAGAIFVKVATLDGNALLFGPAPASLTAEANARRFGAHLNPEGCAEAEVEGYLSRQTEFDQDLWVIEIEDRLGRSFIDE
ncbi:MAG: DUF1491 family protein [Hyphomicrobiaceae bacterium]